MEKLDLLFEHILEIKEDIASIKGTQDKQDAVLLEHIRRTEANERLIELTRTELAPLVTIKHRIEGVFGLIGKICTGVTVTAGVVKIYQFFF